MLEQEFGTSWTQEFWAICRAGTASGTDLRRAFVSTIAYHPDRAFAFVVESLDAIVGMTGWLNVPEAPGLFTEAVKYVRDDDLPAMAKLAVERLRRGPEEGSMALVREIADELPSAFRGLYPELLELRWKHPDIETGREDGVIASWEAGLDWHRVSPFEGCTDADVAWLLEQSRSSDAVVRLKALMALCESRRADVVVDAAREMLPLLQGTPLLTDRYFFRRRFGQHTIVSILNDHDFALSADGQVVQLYTEPGYRLMLGAPCSDEGPAANVHPSDVYRASEVVGSALIGGTLEAERCGMCGGALSVIYDRRSCHVPDDVGGPDVLALCTSCLYWEKHPLRFRHDVGKEPTPLDRADPLVVPEFEGRPPFNPVVAHLVRRTPRRNRMVWSGTGHRLGGPPTWVQSPEYPLCSTCQHPMPFFLQINEDDAEPSRWFWVNGGIAYAFWCDRCRESAWMVQHT